MKVYFLIAYRNLIQRKVRSLMLFTAIAGLAFIFALLLGMVNGVSNAVISNGTALMTGHLNVAGFHKLSQSSANPMVTKSGPIFEVTKKTVTNAVHIIDRVKAFGKIISDSDSVFIPMWGVNMKNEKDILGRLDLAEPRDYIPEAELRPEFTSGNIGELNQRGTLALFAVHAKKLKVRVGDIVTISMPTYRNMSNTKDVKVIAVLKDVGMMSQFNAYLNADDTREIYQTKPDTTGQIMIYFDDPKRVVENEEKLRKALSDAGNILMAKDPNPFWMKFDRVAGESWTGQKLDVTTWEDETSFLKWIVALMGALTFILTIVLSIIIMAGLMNALWMAVKERTTEIGALRAIGMQRGRVLWMFLLESLILSSSATLFGLLLANLSAGFLNALKIPIKDDAFTMLLMTNHLKFELGFGQSVLTMIFLVGLFTLGSLLPAYQGSKLSPINAMNSV